MNDVLAVLSILIGVGLITGNRRFARWLGGYDDSPFVRRWFPVREEDRRWLHPGRRAWAAWAGLLFMGLGVAYISGLR